MFFESEQALEDFFNSENFLAYKSTTNKLTERLTMLEKDNFVKKATHAGTISLLTRSFGRGTDFVVLDEEVKKNGGVHVIQTFFSEDIAEEVQIQGRTARQGEQGSFSMILKFESLEQYNYNNTCFETTKGIQAYDFLVKKRDSLFEIKHEDLCKNVEALTEINNESYLFLDSLKHGDFSTFLKSLILFNKGPALKICKTLCLMDATGSMGHLINKAKAMASYVQKS